MLTGVGVSLKASFFAMPIPLITITDVITNIRKKNIGFASLKNCFYLDPDNLNDNPNLDDFYT